MLTGIDVASLFHALEAVEYELLLFAGFWFAVGGIDEFAVDLCWLLTRRGDRADQANGIQYRLDKPMAVFIPAWCEEQVLTAMLLQLRRAWPDPLLAIFVGIYPNDSATLSAAARGAACDPRVRLIVNEEFGPTTKGACLNRLYRALCRHEVRTGHTFHGIVLQDAEDEVHPRALAVMAGELNDSVFVQLPVVPEIDSRWRWISRHYIDEFAEAHTRNMVVRQTIGAALPSAGVGCAFSRTAIAKLADDAGGQPFQAEALTEDYELGLRLSALGCARFVRIRDEHGQLIATREFFPHHLSAAVRQKARWVHGIAYQGWERIGWGPRGADVWMQLRDRRSPLTALVLLAGYLLIPIALTIQALEAVTDLRRAPVALPLQILVGFNFIAFFWRAGWRCYFTGSAYGIGHGIAAAVRIPISNLIAIMAAHRSLWAYLRGLGGARVKWEKTTHLYHPAAAGG